MRKIIEYLIIYLITGTFVFLGKVFVYMLGDEQAFGESALYYFCNFIYYVVAFYIIYIGVKRLRLNNASKTNRVMDVSIFIICVF